MSAFDATESLTPFRHGRADGGAGAILFDGPALRLAGQDAFEPAWFSPEYWGPQARPVDAGGRGGAWFVDAPFGALVLRHYLRGGLAAGLSRDAYFWQGSERVRSFAEYRLTRALHERGLPVARPVAAAYWRDGALRYRAAILVERLQDVRTLAECAMVAGADAPWEETGRMIARFHRVGLDHADLNAHNILFDRGGRGWLIDFDRGRLRLPATRWRERNLARLRRSLVKLKGARAQTDAERDYGRLRHAYDASWERGS